MFFKIYKTATSLAEPFIRKHIAKRIKQGLEDAGRFNERFGIPSELRGNKPLIWFNAASVGESVSILPLVSKIIDELGYDVIVTTITLTSAKMMEKKLPEGAIHQYVPFDVPNWVDAFLDAWKPQAAFWIDSEIWPNMLQAVKKRNITSIWLNVRISDRSAKRWGFAKGIITELASTFKICLGPKSQIDKLKSLGITWVEEADNLKYCTKAQPYDELKLVELQNAVGARPCVLWSSTHPGEEDMALRVHKTLSSWHPGLLSIILPRHPNRKGEVEVLTANAGLKYVTRSTGELPNISTDVYIADTMGETGLFYKFCKTCFMGGSFADMGGHNIIEPAHYGCRIVYGPLMYNFKDVHEDFIARGASIQVNDEKELADKIHALLAFPEKYENMSQEAVTLAKEKELIIDKIFKRVRPLLEEAASGWQS